MKRTTRNIYLNGTSAYDLNMKSAPRNNPISIDFNANARNTNKASCTTSFLGDLKESFTSFICEGKLNNGLRYCNFSGIAFNRMTKKEAIGTGVLLMSIAIATVFIGV